jgi:NAD(P)-dependent dehydrogenase (short-subunit alcohol dehydrogenase family)
MQSLQGKAVLITGGAKRIGRELAITLARAGARIAITYRDSKSDAESVVLQITQAGGRSHALHCDLNDENSVRSAGRAAMEQLGGLDLLVNNAGAYQTRDFEEITSAEFDLMFHTNVRAPFLLSQVCIPELRQREGRIINIGSLGGIRPWATHAHYCSSKAALHMLTQAMAKALAPEISVNCVAPGMIVFPSSEETDEALHFAKKTPMQRNGTAADVAVAVLFFATCPKFITGQILSVDGGLSLV